MSGYFMLRLSVRRSVLAGAFIVSTFGVVPGLSSKAHAAMAVLDASNLAQTAAIASKTAEMLMKMQSLQETQSEMLDSFGASGAFGAGGDMGGVMAGPPPQSPVGGGGIDVDALRADVSSLTAIVSQVSNMASASRNLDSPSAAIRLVRKSFGLVNDANAAAGSAVANLSPKAQMDMRRSRYTFAQTTASDAVGLAMYQREGLEKSAKSVDQVRSAAKSATTLREQMAVNTAAVLAVAAEVQAMRALMATQVQMSGAEFFATTTPDGFLGTGVPLDQPEGGNQGSKIFQ